MNISQVGQNFNIKDSIPAIPASQESAGAPSFKSYLENSISSVNDLLNVADKQGQELAVGKTENLHEAMISLEKADTALKLLVQIRNKALDAYHQVIQMQV